MRHFRKTIALAASLVGFVFAAAMAQGRRPGDQDRTVSATGSLLPAKDVWGYGTGPSSPNSQGVAGNPDRNDGSLAQSGFNYPEETRMPSKKPSPSQDAPEINLSTWK